MPEARRVALVLVDLEALTEALGLLRHGEITHISTDRFSEGGRIFIAGNWSRGGPPPQAALIRDPGEIGRAVMMPPGLSVIEAFTPREKIGSRDLLWGAVLKVEGAALPPVMPGAKIPRKLVEVEEVPQPADLPTERRGRLVGA